MRSFILSLFLFCVCGVAAADDGWTFVTQGTHGNNKLYIKNGSCYVDAYTNDHVDFIRCVDRMEFSDHTISVATVEVTLPSCRTQVGTLITREFNGTVITRQSVAFGGGNVGSVEFETLCAIAKGMGRL
jgi:hypothetical protein